MSETPLENEKPQEAEIAFGELAHQWLKESAEKNAAYWSVFLRHSPRELVSNYPVQTGVVRLAQSVWPLNLNDGSALGSYPCSLKTQYVGYPLGELSLLSSALQQYWAKIGLQALGALLDWGQVDKAVQWSGWLLSTDLHDSRLGEVAPSITRALCQKFPHHAILVRNIQTYESGDLREKLRACGYTLFTSRQVYFFDGSSGDFLQRSDVKRDKKALENLKEYSVVEHAQISLSEAPRVLELYQKLYLEKHSQLNPQYTVKFVEEALESNALHFTGLRHSCGRLDGVFACFSRGQTLSTPFIGYDTTLPASLGLYRSLVSLLLQRVFQQKLRLNYSSGAGEFKRRRGGNAALEYNAVYTRHLPWQRRLVFALLAFLANQLGARFLEKNQI